MFQAQVGDNEIVKRFLWFVLLLVPETQIIPMKTEVKENHSFKRSSNSILR